MNAEHENAAHENAERQRQAMRNWRALVLGLTLLGALLGWVIWRFNSVPREPPSRADEKALAQAMPVGAIPQVADSEFVSSHACAECHPKVHASWHDSFHRKMTQVVSEKTVVAPMDNVVLESRGRSYKFHRQGTNSSWTWWTPTGTPLCSTVRSQTPATIPRRESLANWSCRRAPTITRHIGSIALTEMNCGKSLGFTIWASSGGCQPKMRSFGRRRIIGG